MAKRPIPPAFIFMRKRVKDLYDGGKGLEMRAAMKQAGRDWHVEKRRLAAAGTPVVSAAKHNPGFTSTGQVARTVIAPGVHGKYQLGQAVKDKDSNTEGRIIGVREGKEKSRLPFGLWKYREDPSYQIKTLDSPALAFEENQLTKANPGGFLLLFLALGALAYGAYEEHKGV